MKNIEFEQLVVFHKKIVARTGGSNGVRDEGLLKSALARGSITFDGDELYTPNERKIAVITYSLICNHGFIDGNKRIGVAIMSLLCKLNGISLLYIQQELIELGLGVASGDKNEEEIFEWIMSHKQ
ncbi:MAG: type II toxin-antitoxin system death-on-curing family toxin [Niameybacter sp.]|uniref:type II toxin-antitoxin system death-on-curing family toxin n=1 Tax=Niameybacter sp. TaxID=2033640 RepID=UPI002FC6B3C4